MKNSTFKRIMATVLCVMLMLAVVFVVSSCKKEHVHNFDEQITEPTCTVAGSITGTCECGETKNEVIPATGHSLENVSGYNPTCTEDGLCAYEVCEICGYSTRSDSHIIPALGHNSNGTVEEKRVDPTCTSDGSYDVVEYCETCGEEFSRYSQTIVSEGHAYETVPAKAATCLPGWYEHYECSVCHEKKDYEEIPAAYKHIWSEYPVEVKDTRVDATCTVDGYYYEAICCTNDNCGTTSGDATLHVLTALGHDIYKVDALDPTCTEEGHEAYEACARCDYTTYVEIPEPGHTGLPAVVEGRVEPTCTVDGEYYNVSYCSVCDGVASTERVVLTAPGHDYVPHEGKPNSCTEIGWNDYNTCSKCDYTSYEEIPAHGHEEGEPEIENLVRPTCTEVGTYDRVFYCTYCKIELRCEEWEVDPVAHNTLGVVDAKAPTCTEIGWEAYTCCSKCGYTETYVELPTTVHNYGADGVCSNCNGYISIGLTVENGVLTGIGNCTDSNVVIPDGVVAIANGVFKNSSVTSVVIPDSVKTIGSDAFFNCMKLESVDLGNGVETIGSHAFFYCTSLKSITISGSVKSVGINAFAFCKNLETVNYCGTVAQWNAIKIDGGNEALTGADRKYN